MPRTARRRDASRLTAFVTLPVCVRCGGQSMARHRDGIYRCAGCAREVLYLDGHRLTPETGKALEKT